MKTITVVPCANPLGSRKSKIMRKAENYGFVRLEKMDKNGRHYRCLDDFECTWSHVNELIEKERSRE